ncbi:MAG: hypothetical protein COT73_11750 [Bdellovibrio sp. CG10_big_fil_rev_8_21_14_0_10_47_8]|nr:MAG: hypothetical protein COT73_11750 [Bdellovibrio sp. CG10_big_fil_rev_8_21_14_0_10_47_8]
MADLQSKTYRSKFPRRGYLRAVGFLVNGEYLTGKGVSLGEGGIALLLPKLCQLAEEVVLTFEIPHGKFICARAEIRHSASAGAEGQYQLECLFTDLNAEYRREIRTFVSERGLH